MSLVRFYAPWRAREVQLGFHFRDVLIAERAGEVQLAIRRRGRWIWVGVGTDEGFARERIRAIFKDAP